MTTNRIFGRYRRRTALALTLLALAATTRAGNLTWNTTGGVWDFATANWTGDATIYTDGDAVTFNTPGSAANVNITVPLAPASIRINTTSTANYFTFTNQDVTGSAGLTQGGGGWVQFSTRKQWSLGGEIASSNGTLVLNPPTLANNDLCHLGTNTIRLSGASLTAQGKLRYTPNTTAAHTGLDQDIVIRGFGTIQTHQSGNINAGMAYGKTLTLEGDGATLLLLEDYTGGGNGGYMVIATNGAIRVEGDADDTREIRLSDFQGNASGFLLSGTLAAGAGFTNPLVLRNMTGKDLRVNGNNAAWSNGFTVAGAPGRVNFNSSASLGAAGSAPVRVDRGGYLALAFPFAAADLARLSPLSEGALGIDASTGVAIDLSLSGMNAPELLLGGSDVNATYSGVLTPYGTVYRFGGNPTINGVPYTGNLLIGNGTATNHNLLTGARSVIVSASPSNTSSFRLQVNNNNDYTGGTLVRARGLLSFGCTGGTPFGSGRVVIESGGGLSACAAKGSFYGSAEGQFTNYLAYAGARFLLDETYGGGSTLFTGSNDGNGRWADSAPIALNGGYLGLGSPKGNTVFETIGMISAEQDSTLRLWNAGGTTRYFLTAAGVQRIGRGLLRIQSLVSATDAITLAQDGYRVRLTAPPALVNGILPPWITDTPNRTFLTYNTGTNIYGEYGLSNAVYTLSGAAVLNGATAPTDIVNQSSDLTLNNSPAVYALKTAQLAGSSYTVTINSGGVIFSGNNKTHSANFNFGGAEALLISDAGQQTLNGTLTGTNGLTKGGGSTIILGANNAATLAGPVTVHQGTLQLNHATTLGQTNDLFVSLFAILNVNAQTNLQTGNVGGHGTINLNVRYLAVNGTLDPGSIGSVGSLTIGQSGTVDFASGSGMAFDLAATNRISDSLAVPLAAVNLNGAPVLIRNNDGLETGTYTLIDTAGGTLSGSPGAVTLPAGFKGSLAVVDNDLVLSVEKAIERGTIMFLR